MLSAIFSERALPQCDETGKTDSEAENKENLIKRHD